MLHSYVDSYLRVDWPAPTNVRAYSTTRFGGFSSTPFEQFNLANHVGDEPANVSKNRKKLCLDLALSHTPLWLEQVHSTNVVSAKVIIENAKKKSPLVKADASFANLPHQACIVMTADCLPVLLTDKKGEWVAAIHAGWRGLAGGIIQNTIAAYSGNPSELIAWMGPTISQPKFEVGLDVRELFLQTDPHFSSAFLANNKGKYFCDLIVITKIILAEHKISTYGGHYCTYSDGSQFFSYRRNAQTGRMASLIWIEDGDNDFNLKIHE